MESSFRHLTLDEVYNKIVSTTLSSLFEDPDDAAVTAFEASALTGKCLGLPLKPSSADEKFKIEGVLMVEVLDYRDVSKPFALPEDDSVLEKESGAHFAQQTGKRSLKLILSDGITQCAGFELEPTSALDSVRIGTKLQLTNVFASRGLLLLTPRSVRLLGSPQQ